MMIIVARHRVCAAALASLLTAAAAHAQEPLPSAASLVARYHRAINADAFAAIRSLHSTGEMVIAEAGIRGSIEVWQGRPNLTAMHAVLPGVGEVRTGFTGEHGWAVDPQGSRLLAGQEAEQAGDDAHFDSHLRTPALVDSMTTIERTSLSGYDCYEVRTFWKSGRQTLDCFATDTGLLVGSRQQQQRGSTAVDALILYQDYQEFAGALIPTRITTRVGAIEQTITLRDLTLNQVPDSAFTPPPSIQALIRS